MILNLMIVDDDETLLEGMSTAVDWAALGFSVVAAAKDGREALELLEAHPADVMLTDIRMGRMDGLELTARARALCPGISVVMMSAYDDFSYAQQAMRLGVEDYLLKPINLEQLDRTMRELHDKLEKSRTRQERYDLIQARLEGIGRMDEAEYLLASSAQNAALVEHIARLTIMGSGAEAAEYIGKLRRRLEQAGDGAFLATVSAANLLVSRMEASDALSEDQVEAVRRARGEVIAAGSLEAGMAFMEEALMGIAGEIAMASGNTEGLMAKARGYVEEHYRDAGLRLRDVANFVGLSTNYFSSMFAKNMGQGFADYLIERRMREALILLGSTDKKNYEVAQLVGYDNPAYFSTAFKKYTGFSISDYRRSLKNRPKDGSEKINKLPD